MLSALRKERILQGKSLWEVRFRTGIAASKLSLAERGLERLSEDEKAKLAKMLGVGAERLFPKGEGLS